MKRVEYHRYGGPWKAQLEEVELPSPVKGALLYGPAEGTGW